MPETTIPVGPFQLTEPIGRGGMAQVWGAVHKREGAPAAVKILTGEALRNPVYLALFRNEVRGIAGLDHPHVVRVFDHGLLTKDAEEASDGELAAGSPWLAMERLDGGTLVNLARDGLSWDQLRDCLLATLDGLAHAHARGVVHRDIKPGNVLLGLQGEIKLTDFGLVHAIESADSVGDSMLLGTPSYMAPEQLQMRTRDFGPWTDLYAVGCMAWTLATGFPPFGRELKEALAGHLHAPPPPFRPDMDLPEDFERWIRWLLVKPVEERVSRAAEAADSLARIAGVPRASWRSGWRRREQRADRPLHGVGLGLLGVRSVAMVDRERERDLLWNELATVDRESRLRVVLLEGAAGNGKTRLARWIAERAHEMGAAEVLRARWSNAGGDALRDMLERDLACDGLTRHEVQARVKLVLRRLGVTDSGERADLTELLAPIDLSDLDEDDLEDERSAPGISARRRRQLLLSWLGHRSRRHPLVFVLDDLQWGPEGLILLRELVTSRTTQRLPVLVVATIQDDALAERGGERALLDELATHEGVLRLRIGPLPRTAHERLIQGLLGLEPGLASRVQRRTVGNPGFALELTADWVRRGLLELGRSGYRLKPGVDAPLPLDLYERWWQRLERALLDRPDEDLLALEIAAHLGVVVDPEEWRDVCSEADLPASRSLLRHLIEQRLVGAQDSDPTKAWSFSQPMLRATLERRATEAGRSMRWHQLCASVLERRRGGRRDERVGYHLVQASLPEDALPWLSRAVDRRLGAGDFPRAEEVLQNRRDALELLALERDDRAMVEQRILEAELARRTGRLPEALLKADHSTAAARSRGYADLLCPALIEQSAALLAQGELQEAHDYLVEALTLASRGADRDRVALCHRMLAEALLMLGRLDEAGDAANAAVNSAQLFADPIGTAEARLWLARSLMLQERLPEALSQLERARKTFRHVGARSGLAESLVVLGELARRQGARERARECFRKAHKQLQSLGASTAVEPFVRLGIVLSEDGTAGPALDTLLQARREADAMALSPLVALANIALLPLAATARNERAWDEAWGHASHLLDATGYVEQDVARQATVAARVAWSQGWGDRAKKAGRVALAQWNKLGLDDQARDMQRLRRLLQVVDSA